MLRKKVWKHAFDQEKSKIEKKKKENNILTKNKRKKTRSWSRKKESNQDLNQEGKHVLRSYFFDL